MSKKESTIEYEIGGASERRVTQVVHEADRTQVTVMMDHGTVTFNFKPDPDADIRPGDLVDLVVLIN